MNTHIPAWIDDRLVPVDKLDVHRRGLRHKAVSVFVLRSGRILIQRRALGKYHTPGLWANTCCTHPTWEERPLDCARRRLGEELGISGLTLTHRGRVEYRADVGNRMIEHELVDIFVAESPAGLAITANPDEVMDTAWVTLDELRADMTAHPERYTPWLHIYLEEHGPRIFDTAS